MSDAGYDLLTDGSGIMKFCLCI